MRCSGCGKELSANSKFCRYCGTPVKRKDVCPKCGNEIIPGNRFCIFCGSKIDVMQEEKKESGHAESLFCKFCGAQLNAGQKFCIVCGTPIGQKDMPQSVSDHPAWDEPEKSVGWRDETTNVSGHPAWDEPEKSVGWRDGTINVSGHPIWNDPDEYPETTLLNEAQADLFSEETVLLAPRRKILVVTDQMHPEIHYSAPIRDEVTIGRGQGRADLVIGNDRAISRVHCRIVLRDGQLYVTDEHSANGTYHDEVQVPAGQMVPFESGDTFRLGQHVYTIELTTE